MGLSQFLSDSFVPRIPLKKTSNRHDAAKLLGKTEDQESTASLQSSTTVVNTALDRRLRGRHVQLLGIGATIGLALFVTIGLGLARGGPLNLLLAFILWACPILFITISAAEMVTYLPITSPFISMAGRCCDLALEVMCGYNFWFLCSVMIPFEIVVVTTILNYWRTDISVVIPVIAQMVLYITIAVFRVSVYGEVDFWLSLGKVIMAVGLIFFTFITMVGGNPKHWAFGFTYWQNPGPLNVFQSTGNLGRFRGFLECLIRATFIYAGPEYVSLVAGETMNPRKTLPSAYKQVFFRLTVFFIGGALCVGILVPYNDPTLQNTAGVTLPGAAGSPYVIAMESLGISVMPDIVNAALVTAAFSAGNSYVYCSSRVLYGLASNGYAPHFLTATTKTEVPIYCIMVALFWAQLSFLLLNDGTAKVLNWIIGFLTSCQLINFSTICLTYVFFYRALKAQGIDRNTFLFVGWYQPWLAIIGGTLAFVMLFVGTYKIFLPGQWSYRSFLFSYLMIFVDIGIFVLYKLFARTKWRKAEEVDLTTGLKEVEEHEMMFYRQLEEEGKMNEEGRIKRTFAQRFFSVIFGNDMK